MRIRVSNIFLNIYMFCSRQRQIRLLSINIDFCQILSLVDYCLSTRGFKENPSWIWGLLLEANSLAFVPSRKYRVYFLQASATSLCNRHNHASETPLHAVWLCFELDIICAISELWGFWRSVTFLDFIELLSWIIMQRKNIELFAITAWLVWTQRN